MMNQEQKLLKREKKLRIRSRRSRRPKIRAPNCVRMHLNRLFETRNKIL